MSERDGYIPGVPCWVDASYSDPAPALEFYGGLFGWEFTAVSEKPGERFFVASVQGGSAAGIGELPAGHPPVHAWNTYVAVVSAEETAEKVTAAGGKVIAPPFDVIDAGRMAIFTDPEGAAFCAWEARRTKGAQRVNEHGAVNFNTLHTADAAAAKEFYGAVFGWRTLDLGPGQFWTLPGYGDYLESLTPGFRQGVAEMGAAGFEDVVAVIEPLADGDAPHWSVTFAVDDADSAARRAEQLGGRVLAAPTDAPWVRFTVIADPLGTSFVASQFVAENRA